MEIVALWMSFTKKNMSMQVIHIVTCLSPNIGGHQQLLSSGHLTNLNHPENVFKNCQGWMFFVLLMFELLLSCSVFFMF